MPTTVTIPLVTLRSKSQTFSFAASAGLSDILVTIDRTVGSNPLNGAAGRSISADVSLSWDGGVTFTRIGSFAAVSGTLIDDDTGLAATVNTCDFTGWPVNPDHVQVALTVVGTISISGSAVFSP